MNGRGYPLQPCPGAASRGHLPLTPAPPHTPHLTAAWKEMQTPLGKGAVWGPAQGRRLLREPGPWSLHSKPNVCAHTPRSRNQQSRSGSKASRLVADERSQQNGPCNSRRQPVVPLPSLDATSRRREAASCWTIWPGGPFVSRVSFTLSQAVPPVKQRRSQR